MSDAKQKAISHYSREVTVEEYEVTRFSSPLGKVYNRLALRIVLDLSNVQKEKVIAIDVGTGTGRFVAALALRGYYVIGLDTSRNMICLAKAKMSRIGMREHTDFVLADMERMPFRQNVFDLAVCIHVLRHLRRHNKALVETKDILKKHGRAIIDMPNEQRKKFVNWMSSKVSDGHVYDKGLTFQELLNLLRSTGLTLGETRTTKNVPISGLILGTTQVEHIQKIIENIEYALSKLPLARKFAGGFVLSCFKD